MSAQSQPPPHEVPAPPAGNEYIGHFVNAFDLGVAGIVSVVVAFRLVTRFWLTEIKLWWEYVFTRSEDHIFSLRRLYDLIIVCAWISTLVGAALVGVQVHFGLGRHEHYLTEHQMFYFSAYDYGEWIQTFLTLMLVKLSICFFLLRLPVNKAYRVPLYIAVAMLVISHFILIMLWVFQCLPVRAVWNANIPGQCFSMTQKLQIILAQAVISVVGDYALALYPILILHKLNMSLMHKIGLGVLMGLGGLTGACGTVRAALNYKALSDDATYGGITNWFWRLFEVNIGIVCACIPALVPGFRWVRTRVNSSLRSQQQRPQSTPPKSLPKQRHDGQQDQFKEPPIPWRSAPVTTMSHTERALLGRVQEDIGLGDLESHSREGGPQEPPITESSFSNDEDLGFGRTQDTATSSLQQGREALVQKREEPKQALDVDVRPDFREHRSIWRRLLGPITNSRLFSSKQSKASLWSI
ncbi:MAG: hypothetical protein M1831_001598 [Alyxoria varia]|nr:MAG: hypothetical protein M1831_001598 [Alyxoria varia]